ncbi:SCP2 sterol-binding domain-containing protein [bacterium]|nr:SCP2 sterol-binding domain-containing protein [bacterium]
MSIQSTTDAVASKAAENESMGSTIKFVMEEGIVYLDGSGDSNTVTNEDKDADCTVNVSKEDFDAMLSGDLNPMAAFMGGKLQVDGDMGVAMKLGTLFG